MHAVDVILRDHAKIRELLTKVKQNDAPNRKKYFEELRTLLLRHETMEQEFFYPSLNEKEIQKVIAHLKEEENKAKDLLHKFDDFEFGSKEWENLLKKLQHEVEHHAEEEETKFLPKVKEKIPDTALLKLGAIMQAFKGHAQRIKKHTR